MATVSGSLRFKKNSVASNPNSPISNTLLIGEPGFAYTIGANSNANLAKLFIGRSFSSASNTIAPIGVFMDSQIKRAGDTVLTSEVASVGYVGTSTTAGYFNGSATSPSNSTYRLNYNGDFYSTKIFSSSDTAIGSGNQRWLLDSTTDTNLYFKSGATGSTTAATLTAAGSLTIPGTMTAATFSGSGASLTSLPAGQLTGTIDAARLPTNTLVGSSSSGVWVLTNGAIPVYSTAVGWYTQSVGTSTQVLGSNGSTPAWVANNSHSHGGISSVGAIGTTSGLPIITTTNGVLTTGSFGTTAGTFTQGNDSRLSDDRIAIFWEGVSSTATTTVGKLVTISGFVRTIGALIRVRFTNGSRVASPTLNINNGSTNTGAANIQIEGANATIDNFSLSENTEVTFRWNGSTYQVISVNNSDHAKVISEGLTIPSGLTASYINVFGARFILLQGYHTSVSPNLSAYNLWIDMTDPNQISTTARSHRVVWNNGSSTFADTIQAQLSGTSVRFASSSGGTWIYRLTAF
jgi:hypothetical protein